MLRSVIGPKYRSIRSPFHPNAQGFSEFAEFMIFSSPMPEGFTPVPSNMNCSSYDGGISRTITRPASASSPSNIWPANDSVEPPVIVGLPRRHPPSLSLPCFFYAALPQGPERGGHEFLQSYNDDETKIAAISVRRWGLSAI